MLPVLLTDWPKSKLIEANYRGMETSVLVALRKQLYHTMMTFGCESVCGWNIEYTPEGIEKELTFRGVKLDDNIPSMAIGRCVK